MSHSASDGLQPGAQRPSGASTSGSLARTTSASFQPFSPTGTTLPPPRSLTFPPTQPQPRPRHLQHLQQPHSHSHSHQSHTHPQPTGAGTAASFSSPGSVESLGPSPKTEGSETHGETYSEAYGGDAAGAATSATAAATTTEAKKPRACEACRSLKVRCDMDPAAPPDTPCRRCTKAGRRCIVTQPTRRRQKKTDSRVAELEKKIDALTASLQMTRGPTIGIGGPLGGGGLAGLASLAHLAGAAGPGADREDRVDRVDRVERMDGADTVSGNTVRGWQPAPAPAPAPAPESATAAVPLERLPNMTSSSSSGSSGSGSGSGKMPVASVLSSSSTAAPSSGPGTTASPLSSGTTISSPFPATNATASNVTAASAASSAAPPMVMAGHKRKFTDMWETRDAGSSSGSSLVRDRQHQSQSQSQHQHTHQHRQQSPRRENKQDVQVPGQSSYSNMSPATETAVAGLGDIIDRGLLTMDKAAELFGRYTDQMARHMPAVVFPAGTTAAEIRKSKPILFVAIMGAATTEMPNVQRAIVKELMQIFAEKILVVGEKSLELVQALQISVIWYWPPEHFEELKFYQLVHMAAVMAIDIGLGKRRPCGGVGSGRGLGVGMGTGTGIGTGSGIGTGAGAGTGGSGPGLNFRMAQAGGVNWRDHPFKKNPLPDPCALEARRAWLSCYFMTSNTSMALHRPNLVRWTSFMTQCVQVLESSAEAAPTDQYLCHLVWTHRMAEEVGQQFSMDDPTVAINVADARTQYALRAFERELERYRTSIPRSLLQPSLRLSFEVLNLYMHEIALQMENGNDEFRQPYTAESTKEALIGDAQLTPAHISALSACLQAIDGIFDAFLGMDIVALRCIPVFNFVRVAYATVVLIKLYFAAASPNSELGRVINKDNMKVEQHLSALLDKFRATAADNRSRPAAKFLVVLVMIRAWFMKQRHYIGSVQQQQQQREEEKNTSVSAGSMPSVQQQQHQQQHQQPYLPSSSYLLANSTIQRSTGAMTGPGNCISPQLPQPQPQPSSDTPYSLSASQPSPMTAYPSVNTPLELLSEIAANDSASQEQQRQQQQQQQQQHMNMVPWLAINQGAPSPMGPGDNAVRGAAGPTESLITSDFMDFPNVGENFEYAMDLTFAGLAETNGDMMSLDEGMQLLMDDPYWSRGIPGNFQV